MATNEEILDTIKELRQEVRAGFTLLNGRVRGTETRLAEHGVRIGTLECRRPDPPAGKASEPLAVFLAAAPWLLRFMVAGAFIACGVNAQAALAALATVFK